MRVMRWRRCAGGCRGRPWTRRMSSKGPEGTLSLLDLFDGRRQLIVYRAFLDPGVHGWPEHGCVGCSLMADHIGNLAHLQRPRHHAGVRIARIAGRHRADEGREWAGSTRGTPSFPEQTAAFDVDFGVDEWHGTNAFIRDGDRVFRTYFINSRGDEVFVNTGTSST